jgi:hypothetical protein
VAGTLDGRAVSLAHHGVRACLIDFTLSRLKTESDVLCTRLDELQDNWLFTQLEGENDPQVTPSPTPWSDPASHRCITTAVVVNISQATNVVPGVVAV